MSKCHDNNNTINISWGAKEKKIPTKKRKQEMCLCKNESARTIIIFANIPFDNSYYRK